METPSFYAIIPAHVRYCKNLEPNAKLLYGELTALASQYGYCWANNQYFADLYDVDVSTVQVWLKSLKDEKFIKVDIIKDGIQTSRKIWISHEIKGMFTRPEKSGPPTLKIRPPHLKNQAHINTEINTHSNTQEREEAAPPPPPVYKSFNKVKIEEKKYLALVEKYGEEKIKEMIERLDEYGDMKPKKFKEYGCHAAVIRSWLRDDKKKVIDNEVKVDEQEHKKIADKVVDNFPSQVERNEIQLQSMGILFCYGRVYELIEFRDIEFRDKLAYRLTKMNLPMERL